jgi:hypothetical protein
VRFFRLAVFSVWVVGGLFSHTFFSPPFFFAPFFSSLGFFVDGREEPRLHGRVVGRQFGGGSRGGFFCCAADRGFHDFRCLPGLLGVEFRGLGRCRDGEFAEGVKRVDGIPEGIRVGVGGSAGPWVWL